MMLNQLKANPLDQVQQEAEEVFCKPEPGEPELSIFLSLVL